jgi:TetR/AcrR family fatty acid metabolism transcriptional regulator
MSSTTRPTKADVVSDFRRGQILDAARQSFIRSGVDGTTVDDIARIAGVAKGTVYLYYRSKDDILRQLLTEDVAALQEGTIPGLSGADPVDRKLSGFLRGMIAFFDQKRDFIDQCQFEMGPEARRKVIQKLDTVYRAQVDGWKAALDRALDAGEIDVIDTHAAATAVVALSHGLIKQRLRGWSDDAPETVVANATSMLWKGLACR